MANYFVDTTLGTGSNNGTTLDDAWQSVETALEYDSFSAGDIVWVRRVSSFLGATGSIQPSGSSDGTLKDWIQIVGCPRAELNFNATFTNGSTTVSIDSGLTADWEQHVGRRIKNDADGKWYLITNVDSGNLIIDREYASSTASNGACTIEEDEHYDEFDSIDDAAWTIKIADWQADADDLPLIDFEATGYYIYMTGAYMWRFVGLRFAGGTYSYGGFYIRSASNIAWKLCIWDHDQNSPCIGFNSDQNSAFFNQCIMKGSGAGSSQSGIGGADCGQIVMTDCAIYGMGGYGINQNGASDIKLNNVNIGVEIANGNNDIVLGPNDWYWIDVKLGGTNGEVLAGLYYRGSINIENYNKLLGDAKTWTNNGSFVKTAVSAGSGDPEKRSGGADFVWAIEQNQSDNSRSTLFRESMLKIFEHRFYVDTNSHSYRYYIQADSLAISDADELFIEAEYTDAYDDTSEYHVTRARSDETISARSGASDWSQYVEVTGVQSAVEGWVIIRCYIGFYDADGTLYIDPLPVVS